MSHILVAEKLKRIFPEHKVLIERRTFDQEWKIKECHCDGREVTLCQGLGFLFKDTEKKLDKKELERMVFVQLDDKEFEQKLRDEINGRVKYENIKKAKMVQMENERIRKKQSERNNFGIFKKNILD